MNKMTRRRFIQVLGATVTALTGGIVIDRLVLNAPIDFNTPTGDLSSSETATLEAYVQALFLYFPLRSTAHYGQFFRYQAQYVEDSRGLYQEMVVALDAQANEQFTSAFADLELSEQREIAEKLLSIHNQLVQVTRRDRIVHAVTAQVMEYYMHTDAYLALGYVGWAGSPRGLDAYRQAPSDVL